MFVCIQITNFIIYLHAIRTIVFNFFFILTSVLTLQFHAHLCQFANVVFFFFDYLPEDGRKRPKHVGGLLCDCIHLHRTAVQVLE